MDLLITIIALTSSLSSMLAMRLGVGKIGEILGTFVGGVPPSKNVLGLPGGVFRIVNNYSPKRSDEAAR